MIRSLCQHPVLSMILQKPEIGTLLVYDSTALPGKLKHSLCNWYNLGIIGNSVVVMFFLKPSIFGMVHLPRSHPSFA